MELLKYIAKSLYTFCHFMYVCIYFMCKNLSSCAQYGCLLFQCFCLADFSMEHFVCNLFYRSLTTVPALVRQWYNSLPKSAALAINRYAAPKFGTE